MDMLKQEKFYIFIFILTLLCVNPPVLVWVNQYAVDHPLTLGYPTVWVWLQFWYFIACFFFLLGACLLPAWNKAKYKEGDIV